MMVKFYVGNREYVDVEEALEGLLGLLLARAQRKLDTNEELEFQQLRRALMRERGVSERLPRLVTENSESGGVWSVLREHSDRWEPRREFVREQMRSVLDFVRSQVPNELLPSSNWTGIGTKRERLQAARELLPLARVSVAGLIAELERPQGNGGPPLDDRAEAIRNLRELHTVLGQLISELDVRDTLNSRLLREASSYLTRAAKALKDDPMPYLVSAGLWGFLSLFGVGGIGAYAAGVAMNIRKNSAEAGAA